MSLFTSVCGTQGSLYENFLKKNPSRNIFTNYEYIFLILKIQLVEYYEYCSAPCFYLFMYLACFLAMSSLMFQFVSHSVLLLSL